MTGRAPVTDENRKIAQTVADLFGGRPTVNTWWNTGRRNSVDILSSEGSPGAGATAWATVTLSNHPLKDFKDDFRVELLGACDSAVTGFADVLSTCAFNIIDNDAVIGPGAVFPAAVSIYELSKTMEHILFIPPFFWDGAPAPLTLSTRKVNWLLALPISDAELEHVREHGYRSLQDVMEEKGPRLMDINRPSVV